MKNKLIKEFHEKVDELVSSLKHLNFNVNNYDSKASIKIANILKENGYDDDFDDWEKWEPSSGDYVSDDEWDYPVPFDEWKEKNENITKNIYLKLLKEFHNKEQDIADKLKETEANPKSWSIYNDLYDVLKKEGYDIIGSGISRVVFSKIDVPFVIKLASYPNTGVFANKSEIKFSTKEDTSSQVSSIVPELYSYSEDKNPMWIICEKVIPVEESSIENLIKSFPTLYYFAKQKTLNDGSIVERDLTKDEFLLLVKNVFFNITKKTNVNMNIALSIIKRQCKLIYSEDYDLIKIRDTLPLLDIKRFIESTSYDYTMDLHLGNLGIRNEKTINHNSFFILDFDPKIGGSKKQIRHTFDSNPEHPSHPEHDAKLIRNSVAEAVYKRLMIESLKQKRKYSGSHPYETYKYGWPEFDESWLDAKGLTTREEDRKKVKDYLKKMGML